MFTIQPAQTPSEIILPAPSYYTVCSFYIRMDFSSENASIAPNQPSLKRTYPFDTDEYSYTYCPRPTVPFSDQHASVAWSNQETCFGSVIYQSYGIVMSLLTSPLQIIGVKVLPHNVGSLKKFGAWSSSIVQPFAVTQEGDFLALEHCGVKFGRLNKGLCRNLHGLISRNGIRAKAFILGKELAQAISGQNGRTSDHLPAEINIYGSKTNAQWIGSTLSKSGIFLQSPKYGSDVAEYYNPHILRMEGYSDLLSLEPSQECTSDAHELPDGSTEGYTGENDTAMVDSILDSLSHHHVLQEMTFVPNIKTAILT